MHFGMAVKAIRKEAGLSQEELAAKIGMSQTAFSQMENRADPPHERAINALGKALEFPSDFFYMYGLEAADFPKENEYLYSKLMPVIRNMIKQFV